MKEKPIERYEGATLEERVSSGKAPTSWRLERRLRQVTFAQCSEMSVFSETTSARMATPHAHPAWTLLLPVDGGAVTVVAGDAVRVHKDGVLLAPQSQYRAATDGPHVAVYANAWRAARPESMTPRMLGAAAAQRVVDVRDGEHRTDLSGSLGGMARVVGRLGARALRGGGGAAAAPGVGAGLAADHGTDLSGSMVELARLVGRIGALDPRLAFVIEALPDADRLDGLAIEVGISPSRLRALAYEDIGVPLTQLRLWSRLARAIAWLPYGSTAAVATAAGFADQAHFTRTARRFLGRTPGELSLRPLAHQPRNG